jgi:hypothetical protein
MKTKPNILFSVAMLLETAGSFADTISNNVDKNTKKFNKGVDQMFARFPPK